MSDSNEKDGVTEEQQAPQQSPPNAEAPQQAEATTTTTATATATAAKEKKAHKKRNFRHDLPVARPFTEVEIAAREAQWNGSFSVTRRERQLPDPPGKSSGTSPQRRQASPTSAANLPMLQSSSTLAAQARIAAQEWLQQVQKSNPTSGDEGAAGDGHTPRKRKVHHLGSSGKATEPFHPSDDFVVAPVTSKFFEGPRGYEVPAAHKIFTARGGAAAGASTTTPRSTRGGSS